MNFVANTTKEHTMNMDACGYTEREWEALWNSETATATAHFSSMDDENYCELCDSPVVYSGPSDSHGTCGCDEVAA